MVHRQDKITLTGIKLHPRLGTTSEERESPQECEADLVLWGDFQAAAFTDSLEQSVDYSQVISLVQRIAGDREYNLVETLAHRIAREVLQSFPIDRVSVKLRKRPASLLEQISFIEVEVEAS
jgi:dihydroneopterin aldolase